MRPYRPFKPIPLAELESAIRADIARRVVTLAAVRVMVATLRQFDGKAVSRRMQTAVAAALPGFNVQVSDVAGMAYLDAWQAGQDSALPYSNRVHMMLVYRPALFSYEKLTRPPGPNGGKWPDGGYSGYAWPMLQDSEVISRLESLLAELPAKLARYNAAAEAYESAREELATVLPLINQ